MDEYTKPHNLILIQFSVYLYYFVFKFITQEIILTVYDVTVFFNIFENLLNLRWTSTFGYAIAVPYTT